MHLVVKSEQNPSWKSYVKDGRMPSCSSCHWSSEGSGILMCGAHLYAGDTSLVTGHPESDQKVRCAMVRTSPRCKLYTPRDDVEQPKLGSIPSIFKVMTAATGVCAAAAAVVVIWVFF